MYKCCSKRYLFSLRDTTYYGRFSKYEKNIHLIETTILKSKETFNIYNVNPMLHVSALDHHNQ